MDVIVMVEGATPAGIAREHRYQQPSAALANARTVYHAPAVRAAREVWNG
ncbi:hypothetical protein ABZ547_43630 [Streptomyces sparsogenes]